MDNKIEMYKEMVLKGEKLEKEQAMELLTVDLDELCKAADEIRKAFCDNKFDMCTIINGKSGRCSENCKYCAQAACHKTEVENYPLLSTEEILEDAKKDRKPGRAEIFDRNIRKTAECNRSRPDVRVYQETPGRDESSRMRLLWSP